MLKAVYCFTTVRVTRSKINVTARKRRVFWTASILKAKGKGDDTKTTPLCVNRKLNQNYVLVWKWCINSLGQSLKLFNVLVTTDDLHCYHCVLESRGFDIPRERVTELIIWFTVWSTWKYCWPGFSLAQVVVETSEISDELGRMYRNLFVKCGYILQFDLILFIHSVKVYSF